MTIRIKKNSTSMWYGYLLLLILFEIHWFYLPGINDFIDYAIVEYLMTFVMIVGFFGIMLQPRFRKQLGRECNFINGYLFVLVGILLIEVVYSMVTYHQTVTDLYICIHPLLRILLVYPLFYLFRKLEGGWERIFQLMYRFSWIMVIYELVAAFLANQFRVLLISGMFTGFRENRVRSELVVILIPAYIYAGSKLFSEKGKTKYKAGIFMVLACALELYAMMSRMLILVMLLIPLFMWLFKHRPRENWKVVLALLVAGIAIGYVSGAFNGIIHSFSTQSANGASTAARYDEIHYYMKYVKSNPVFGMGFIRPYRADLIKIVNGPDAKFFLDDIGYVGLIAQMGITSALIYILPMLRMLWITIRLYGKIDCKKYCMMIGMLTYPLIGSTSLLILNVQRSFMFPLFWGLMEYFYMCQKEKKEELSCLESSYSIT